MDSPSPRRYPENQNLLPSSPHNIPSPNSSCSSNNGVVPPTQQLPPLSPTTPKSMTRSSESSTYPTTFVQADSSSFKQVVQMLTGSSETAKKASAVFTPNNNHMIPTIKTMPTKQSQQSCYKLYQRRNNNLNINPLFPSFPNPSGFFSPAEVALSPSILDFPSLVLSPVTPLIPYPFIRSESAAPTGYALYPYLDTVAEEKGFFLHPSPSTTPSGTEPPRLLPLFPTTSPRAGAEGAGASSPSSSKKSVAFQI